MRMFTCWLRCPLSVWVPSVGTIDGVDTPETPQGCMCLVLGHRRGLRVYKELRVNLLAEDVGASDAV